MNTLEYVGTLKVITCSTCGVTFGLDEDFVAARKRDHKTWFCPNGCRRYYPGESDLERAQRLHREALEAADTARRGEQFWREREQDARHRERAQKAAKTRIKRRVGKGVCPCCSRTFDNLAAHMENKHPEWGEEA